MCTTNRIALSFPPGTIIIDLGIEIETGKFVIARHKETGPILFRQLKNIGLSRKLMPLNPLADDHLYDDVKIIGVMVTSINLNL